MHFIGVGLRLLQATDSAEVSYTVASMTISIDAKCYFSRLYQVTQYVGTAVSRTMGFGYHKRGSILLR